MEADREITRRRNAFDYYMYDMTEKLASVAISLVAQLRTHLSEGEYSKITSEQNPQDQARNLIEAVRSRLDYDVLFTKFCSALEKVKHSDMARKLQCKPF